MIFVNMKGIFPLLHHPSAMKSFVAGQLEIVKGHKA